MNIKDIFYRYILIFKKMSAKELQSKRSEAKKAFDNKDYKKASEIYLKIAQNNQDTMLWFNVMTSTTLAGDILLSKEALNRAISLSNGTKVQSKQELTIPYIHYYYLCALNQVEEFNDALQQLNILRDIYEPIHIMDDTFLHIRGIPTFSGIMEQALKTFKGLGNSFDAKNWGESFSKSLDEDGKRIISNTLKRLLS